MRTAVNISAEALEFSVVCLRIMNQEWGYIKLACLDILSNT